MSSSEQGFRNVVDRMRGWGQTVVVTPGAYGRNNGIQNYDGGRPIGHTNHHFVCKLNPAQGYIDGLVQMLINGYGDLAGAGSVVPWFQDVNGVSYLIADGPSNHSGKGSSILLSRRQNGLPPAGAAVHVASDNAINGNKFYSGSEKQHPGDDTPWPDALIKSTVMLNAAEAIEFADGDAGYAFMHYEHTDRKVDMSWKDGPNGDGGPELRRRVAALIAWHKSGGTGVPPLDAQGRMVAGGGNTTNGSSPVITKPTPPVEEDDMYSPDDRARDVQTAKDIAAVKRELGMVHDTTTHLESMLGAVGTRTQALVDNLKVLGSAVKSTLVRK
jgi:hypothetical protein